MSEVKATPEAIRPSAPLKVYRALDKQLALAEHVQTTYVHTPEYGTPYEALFDPGYWVNIAAKLRAFTKVIVRTEDESYYAELLVRRCTRTEALMRELIHKDFTGDTATIADASPDFSVDWGGPVQLFRVKRNADGAVISKGHLNKGDAQIALNAHVISLKH